MVGNTLHDLAMRYVESRLARSEIGTDTARNQRYILAAFAGSYGNRPIAHLSRSAVERWLAGISHLAPATRRSRYSAVHTFCRWLVFAGHVRRDPCVGIPGPRQPRSVPRALSLPSVAAVLSACPDTRAVLIVTLMVQQGLRCCEVSRLQMGDIDRLSSVMLVRGKGGHERILPITAETDAALADYLADCPTTAGPLVRSRLHPSAGLAPDTISRLVGRWINEAGIKTAVRDGISAHAMRHTAATDMLRAGAHLRDVQHALGHAHLATTEIYLPHLVHGLERAMGGRRYGQLPLDAAAEGA